MTELLPFGEMELKTGMLDASDPCNDNETFSGGFCRLNNVKKGKWEAFVSVLPYEDRVSRLIICHKDYVSSLKRFYLDFGYFGFIVIDAGLAGFFEDKPNYDNDAWQDLCDNEFDNKKSFSKETYGVDAGVASKESEFGCVGVWSESGYGDGSYDVFIARNDDGEIIAAYITFIVDEYDDEDGYVKPDDDNDYYDDDDEGEECYDD